MKQLIIVFIFFIFSDNSFADCLILKDLNTQQEIIKAGNCNIETSPCSTFKIPLSLIGYDTRVLIDENNPLFKYKDEYKATITSHKQNQTPTSWIKNSVVWYSKEIVKIIGFKKIREYLKEFNYGNYKLNNDNLTNFWLSSTLKITPQEQIKFLENILLKKFKISEKSYNMTESIVPIFENNNWKIHGKTGTCLYDNDTKQTGWFIGWAEKDNKIIIFVKFIDKNDDLKNISGIKAKNEIITLFNKLKLK